MTELECIFKVTLPSLNAEGKNVWDSHVACSNVFVKLIGRLDCGCLVSKPWGVIQSCLFFSPAKGACVLVEAAKERGPRTEQKTFQLFFLLLSSVDTVGEIPIFSSNKIRFMSLWFVLQSLYTRTSSTQKKKIYIWDWKQSVFDGICRQNVSPQPAGLLK